MARCLYLIPFLLTLGGCDSTEATGPHFAPDCPMITAADLPRLHIYVDRWDLYEAVDPSRAAVTGEPSSTLDDPDFNWSFSELRLTQARYKDNECMSVAWKVVPVGPNPASGADFAGGRLPSGMATVSKYYPDEVYIRAQAIDDRLTERNEQFRIELMDRNGTTMWGQSEPEITSHGQRTENPNAVLYTIHDTERDCQKPGAGSGFKLSIEESGGTYRLVIEQPRSLEQCAYVAWNYLDDTLTDDHDDADHVLKGVAYFSSDEESAAFGGYQQWFDLGIPVSKSNAGKHVRVAWGLGSERPAVAILTIPEQRRD